MAGYGNVGSGAADVGFQPKVWSDHVTAYFNKKLVLGQLAMVDTTLTAKPGETVNFPFFKAIGAAEEPNDATALTVDKLLDDSFSCTVKEVGKSVGWKDSNIRASAASRQVQEAEAQGQIARVLAEKVDADIITAIAASGAHVDGLVATGATDVLTIRTLMESKVKAFGDRHGDAVAVAMHSLNFLDIMKDNQAGFLQANAVDPMYGLPGFQGRLLGMAVFTLDQMPEVAAIGGKRAFECYMFKANPFGIYKAEELRMEMDRDILYRETLVAATMWYGVLSLHGKVHALDKRVARSVFAASAS